MKFISQNVSMIIPVQRTNISLNQSIIQTKKYFNSLSPPSPLFFQARRLDISKLAITVLVGGDIKTFQNF